MNRKKKVQKVYISLLFKITHFSNEIVSEYKKALFITEQYSVNLELIIAISCSYMHKKYEQQQKTLIAQCFF